MCRTTPAPNKSAEIAVFDRGGPTSWSGHRVRSNVVECDMEFARSWWARRRNFKSKRENLIGETGRSSLTLKPLLSKGYGVCFVV